VNWVFSSSLFGENMNKIKSRMEQAKYYKKYYGLRKSSIGEEKLNKEHKQEYEKRL
jgi:hypothetical protein